MNTERAQKSSALHPTSAQYPKPSHFRAKCSIAQFDLNLVLQKSGVKQHTFIAVDPSS